jgi:hypothetical protein
MQNAIKRRLMAAGTVGLVWLAVFSVYRFTDRPLKIIDVQAVIRLPISLWNEGDLDVDEFTGIPQNRGLTLEHRGHSVSVFPFWPSLQLFPVYAAYGFAGRFPTEATVWTAQRRGAQLSMGLTAVLAAAIVARRFGRWVALLAIVAFAFGTINWFVLSQLAFSNGLVQLWVAAALVVGLWRLPPSPLAAAASLMMLVVAAFYRLNVGVFAAFWVVYLVLRLRRRALVPLAAAAALALAMAAANLAYMGHPLGFYGLQTRRFAIPSPTLWIALYGNLLSPARGLLVYSPWIALAALGLAGRDREEKLAWWSVLAGCVAHFIVTSNYPRWYGGGSMGPRLTADLLPAWTFLAAGGFAWCFRRRWATVVAILAVATSCVIAGGHAFSHSQRWEHIPVTSDVSPDRLFDWRDALVLVPFRMSHYEDRYPIRLLEPGPDTTVTSEKLPLEWDPGDHIGSLCVVDLSFYRLPPGLRIDRVTIEAMTHDRLKLDRGVLPADLDHGKPVAWRVRALDGRGRTRAQSAWRRLKWLSSLAPATRNSSRSISRMPIQQPWKTPFDPAVVDVAAKLPIGANMESATVKTSARQTIELATRPGLRSPGGLRRPFGGSGRWDPRSDGLRRAVDRARSCPLPRDAAGRTGRDRRRDPRSAQICG